MHPHQQLLEDFYEAFSRRDHKVMAQSYHPEARFSDPVFPDLKGEEIGMMWRMLCERGKDLELQYSAIEADDASGSAHWDAQYTFSATGRKVRNRIDATFRFKDGLIIEHNDRFDLWAWTRMALGLPGVLLGWTPILQNKVRGQAAAGLKSFQKKRQASDQG